MALLDEPTTAPEVETSTDAFGFTWLRCTGTRTTRGMAGSCTDLHAVNTTLESEGFGPALLCSLVPFADPSGRRVGLVYLYKQGTFYPFAPPAPQQRDNLLELQVRDALRAELPIEPELSALAGLWGAPASLTGRRVPGASCRAGRASAAGRPWPTARSPGRPRSG